MLVPARIVSTRHRPDREIEVHDREIRGFCRSEDKLESISTGSKGPDVRDFVASKNDQIADKIVTSIH